MKGRKDKMSIDEIQNYASKMKTSAIELSNNYQDMYSYLNKIDLILSKNNDSTFQEFEELLSDYREIINEISDIYVSYAEKLINYGNATYENLQILAKNISTISDALSGTSARNED